MTETAISEFNRAARETLSQKPRGQELNTINYDSELRRLISEFMVVRENINMLQQQRRKFWLRDTRELQKTRDLIFHSISEILKHVSPKYKEQLKKEFYSKWSIYLP